MRVDTRVGIDVVLGVVTGMSRESVQRVYRYITGLLAHLVGLIRKVLNPVNKRASTERYLLHEVEAIAMWNHGHDRLYGAVLYNKQASTLEDGELVASVVRP